MRMYVCMRIYLYSLDLQYEYISLLYMSYNYPSVIYCIILYMKCEARVTAPFSTFVIQLRKQNTTSPVLR